MTEEERAELHRQQAKARERHRNGQERALRGDPAKVKAAKQAWQPVVDWVQSR